jgi:hypothetical protein
MSHSWSRLIRARLKMDRDPADLWQFARNRGFKPLRITVRLR